MPEAQQQQPPGQRVDIDLDRLVARYGTMIAQATMQTEVAQQQAQQQADRADRAERAVQELTARIEHLEDATQGDTDD